MLYSAKYNFIYSKSAKTASTSTEAALEYLIRDDFGPHRTNSKLYPDGSRIGFRGSNMQKDPNFNTSAFSFNHQTLEQTKSMIGEEIFNSSFKISSIRNPYDRLISAFHFFDKQKIPIIINLKQNGRNDEIKNRFASFVKNNKFACYDGREHFFCKKTQRKNFSLNFSDYYREGILDINNNSEMLIDKFVRMESITNDLEEIFDHLKIPKKISSIILSQLPQYKKTERKNSPLNFSDYYTEEILDITNQMMTNWFEWGGYIRCESIEELKDCYVK